MGAVFSVITSVDLHQKTIEILRSLSKDQNARIIKELSATAAEKREAASYLLEAIMHASELRETKNDFSNIIDIAETAALRLISNIDEINSEKAELLKDALLTTDAERTHITHAKFARLLTNSKVNSETGKPLPVARQTVSDIRNNKRNASFRPIYVMDICSLSADRVKQRFWKNVMYIFDANLNVDYIIAGQETGIEQDAYDLLIDAAENLFNITYPSVKTINCSLLEITAGDFYTSLSQYAKEKNISITDPYGEGGDIEGSCLVDKIGISGDTWDNWKKSWGDARTKGFKDGAPTNRLQRSHLMKASVILKLSKEDSIKLLYAAGYRYDGKKEDEIMENYYSSGKSNADGEDALEKLAWL